MSKRVWKFPVPSGFANPILHFPASGVIRGVWIQNNLLCLWVEFVDGAHHIPRQFHVVATGQEIPEAWDHVDSFIDGEYVWHLYEESLPDDPNGVP